MQHSGRVLGRVEVLPLQVVVVPNGSSRLLLLDPAFARLHREGELPDDVVRKSLFRAEPDVDDQVRGGQVVEVASLGPILGTLYAVVLLQVCEHDNHVHAL